MFERFFLSPKNGSQRLTWASNANLKSGQGVAQPLQSVLVTVAMRLEKCVEHTDFAILVVTGMTLAPPLEWLGLDPVDLAGSSLHVLVSFSHETMKVFYLTFPALFTAIHF
jgi:hypothetical protein